MAKSLLAFNPVSDLCEKIFYRAFVSVVDSRFQFWIMDSGQKDQPTLKKLDGLCEWDVAESQPGCNEQESRGERTRTIAVAWCQLPVSDGMVRTLRKFQFSVTGTRMVFHDSRNIVNGSDKSGHETRSCYSVMLIGHGTGWLFAANSLAGVSRESVFCTGSCAECPPHAPNDAFCQPRSPGSCLRTRQLSSHLRKREYGSQYGRGTSGRD